MLKKVIAFFCLVLIFGACNTATEIGEQLLSDEKLDLFYKNNFVMPALTEANEEPISYSYYKNNLGEISLTTPETGIIGELKDSKFGYVKSSVYSKIIYNPNFPIPIFNNLVYDSAVMVLAYDTLGFYGDKTAVHNLIVEEIDEDYKDKDTIYTSQKLATKKVIGSKTFIPNSKDSLSIINHSDSTKQKLSARIRIKMDDEWAKSFYLNPIIKEGPTEESNDKLYSVFKGVKISSTTDGKSLFGVNLNTSSISSSGITRLTLYFTESDGDKTEYSFYFSQIKFNSFEIDKTGSSLDQFINNPAMSDSLLFLQSFNGPGFNVELKDLSALKNKNINHAALEFTVAPLDDNLTNFTPVTQLIASRKLEGDLAIITDVADLIQNNLPLTLGFGGALTKSSSGKYTYSINITKHLKELLKDDKLDRRIYITANNRSIRPNRSVIYGPKHSQNPIKLRVTFTD